MLQRIKPFLTIALLAVICREASAFSLIGAFQPWQVQRIGHNVPGDIGGVMNLGEEYRWNNPFIYYALDRNFLDYFGSRGEEEIDKAIKTLNDLPKMSSLDPNSYPLKTQRSNYRAQALNLLDLKSIALSTLLEEIGLTSPSRYVFCLRSRFIGPGGPTPTNYFVIKRNFDPITFEPTSYINGDLWTYVTITDGDIESDVINRRVDPLAYGAPVADSSGNGGFTFFQTGDFFTGLTRDDVGGLRYIYSPLNKNVENPIPNAFGSTFGGGPILSGGGQANGSPWEPFFISTNGIGTTVGGAAGSPWAPVAISTNNATGTPPAGGGVTPAGTNNFISTALRGGPDKLNFVKAQYDSLLGQFLTQVLDTFTDTIITNGAGFSQTLQRIISVPDILFTADDISGPDTTIVLPTLARTANWVNNAVINNRNLANESGPGTIAPTVTITFNNVGLANFNFWPPSLDEPGAGLANFAWGSFDGTTNEPIVYPAGISIQDLERRALGGR
ncbi:MAG: hypothetical protein ABI651_06060 [Verrucomicrobiota bacterium]